MNNSILVNNYLLTKVSAALVANIFLPLTARTVAAAMMVEDILISVLMSKTNNNA